MANPIDAIASLNQSQLLHATVRGPQRESEIVDAQRAADTARARRREARSVAAAPGVTAVNAISGETPAERQDKSPWRPRRKRKTPAEQEAKSHIDIVV
jgi:hypothetical protein